MNIDGVGIFRDLIQAAVLALFAVCALYVRDIGSTVKEIQGTQGKHGERIARLEGARESE